MVTPLTKNDEITLKELADELMDVFLQSMLLIQTLAKFLQLKVKKSHHQ